MKQPVDVLDNGDVGCVDNKGGIEWFCLWESGRFSRRPRAMKALLSLQPEFAGQIFAGAKRFAIKVSSLRLFQRGRSLFRYHVETAPQSFVWV